MDLQLYSIEQMPTTVPLWDTILEDLGRPPPARLARVLGVGRTTVYRWNAVGHAPRPVLLALFWLTRWGRSAVNTQAVNDAVMAVQLARSYREECNKLRALGPGELAWPAIEPTATEAVETLALPGRFCVVGTETSPPAPPFLGAPARSNGRANTAVIPPIQGGEAPMNTPLPRASRAPAQACPSPAAPPFGCPSGRSRPAREGGTANSQQPALQGDAAPPRQLDRPTTRATDRSSTAQATRAERPAPVGGVPPTPPAPRARSTSPRKDR